MQNKLEEAAKKAEALVTEALRYTLRSAELLEEKRSTGLSKEGLEEMKSMYGRMMEIKEEIAILEKEVKEYEDSQE